MNMKNGLSSTITAVVMCILCGYACGQPITSNGMYGMGTSNANVYKIDPVAGTVTTVSSTALFASSAIAFDGAELYYWRYLSSTATSKLAKWDPLTDTHTLVKDPDPLEHNATSNAGAEILLIEEGTDDLYIVEKGTGARTKVADISGNALQFSFGDIACGPDDKLYITTGNIDAGYDTKNNYVWDSVTGLSKLDGAKYSGLAWFEGSLYGSRNVIGTGAVFELDPTDFSEVSQVATAPAGIPLNDLGALVPEPATLALLLIGGLALLRRRRA